MYAIRSYYDDFGADAAHLAIGADFAERRPVLHDADTDARMLFHPLRLGRRMLRRRRGGEAERRE